MYMNFGLTKVKDRYRKQNTKKKFSTFVHSTKKKPSSDLNITLYIYTTKIRMCCIFVSNTM